MKDVLSKITRPQIMIIGGVLALLIGIGFYFGLIKPLNEQFDVAEAKYNSEKQVADQRASAEATKKANEKIVAAAERDYKIYENRYFSYTDGNGIAKPIVDTSDLIRAMEQRWQEQTVRLGPLVKKFLEQDKSVRILSANLAVPAPPSDPNAANTKVIELPLGTVTVAGTFKNILAHVDRWNRFNRLVVADGLSLQGNSPQLVGSYSLTCYIFTRSDKSGEAIPQAGAGQGGGFGGGPPAGFGGGGPPPGMAGGMAGGYPGGGAGAGAPADY